MAEGADIEPAARPLHDVAAMDDAMARKAQLWARAAHAGQEYSGGEFFGNHLARVVATLERFGPAPPLLRAAAWLHDVVEDTPTTVAELRREFGDDLATLVWRLTDELGGSRSERQRRTHEKIRADADAVRVKLADRIANVESARERRSHLMGMYRREYRQFRDELYRRGEYEPMWAALERVLWARSAAEPPHRRSAAGARPDVPTD